VILLLDALIGACGLAYWQKLFPSINFRRLIAIEIAAALVLFLIHAWLN
jgi:hypothetical protein